MANGGSDYQFLQYRRLMDRACTINYAELFNYLNDDAVRATRRGRRSVAWSDSRAAGRGGKSARRRFATAK